MHIKILRILRGDTGSQYPRGAGLHGEIIVLVHQTFLSVLREWRTPNATRDRSLPETND